MAIFGDVEPPARRPRSPKSSGCPAPMSDELSAQIKKHFASLTDPRRRKVTYPLINIVTIALCAVIAGADDFVTIAAWGRQKRAWLARFLDLSSGIPSHDRFNAIFKAIKPAEFERCLLSWITSLHEVTAGQLVAIDGKTLRQSFDKADAKSAIHMVSAWATANHISLGQVVVDREEQRDHRHPQAAGTAGCLRLPGDHRRHGLPGRDRREDRRGQGRLRAGGQRRTSPPCTRGSWSSSWTTWRTTSPG